MGARGERGILGEPGSADRAAGKRSGSTASLAVPSLSPAAVALMGAGAAAAFLVPALPATPWLWGAFAVAFGSLLLPRAVWLGWLLFGFVWTLLHGAWALQQRLPADLAGKDLLLTVQIEGLPEARPRLQRFDARVVDGVGEGAVLRGRRLRLSWYDDAARMLPGEVWRLPLRLKPPRGVLNPGGFDFERYALQQRLAATGYVRDGGAAERLATAQGIDAVRERIAGRINDQAPAAAGFLRGLAVGDTRGLNDADWDVLRVTGLSHLLAISGLHIGLVAGLGALFARVVYRWRPRLGLRWPRPQGAAALALLFAAAYAALAGFGLPTQRTLAMLVPALAGVLLRRRVGAAQALALAALVILLFDPLALLGAGFWLSFMGVAWLLLCMPAESGLRAAVGGLFRAQAALTLGLMPLTLWFFGQASLVGAALNLIAVPWVSLLVVPLTLFGTALLAWPVLAAWPLWLAGQAMSLLWTLAQWCAALPHAQLQLPEPGLPVLLLALCGVLWLLLPRGMPGKPFAALLLLPLLWPRVEAPAPGSVRLDVFDVGQGLSLLVRTADHALLYDAGPAFAGGLDLGEAAVLPALRALGVKRLDRIVISHGDNDHVGGSAAIRRAFPDAELVTGEPRRLAPAQPCIAGQRWVWDGVEFAFLHPPEHFPELKNQSSCVLEIGTASARALLTGDIDTLIEERLLNRDLLRPASVLLVPHHGSGGSSSARFVAAVKPDWALISAGHRNRFDHPRPEIVARYQAAGAGLLSTVDDGMLSLLLTADGDVAITRWREARRRFWHASTSE